ncbi:MFS general substrate transporter [Apiospora marii]|uniref:MFS general substrate transporter n=1 Tax=Apiospora marii TaxID=335849 RepID=UPI00312FB5F5
MEWKRTCTSADVPHAIESDQAQLYRLLRLGFLSAAKFRCFLDAEEARDIPRVCEAVARYPRNPENEGKPSLDLPQLPGVTATRPAEDDGGVAYIAGWKDDDPLNPHNWTLCRKCTVAFALCLLTVANTLVSSVDAPEYGGAIVVRFLTGLFGSTPMTAAGGTMADVWGPLQMVYAIPLMAMTSYAEPLLGLIVGAYLPVLGFRWADWISLIFAGTVLVYVFLLKSDGRYRAGEHATAHTLGRRLLVNIYRPFLLVSTEPVILIFTFYLTVVYFVLFTFLNGYPFILQPLTFIIRTALLKAAAAGMMTPEICLWYKMLGGSLALPVSIWWMAWTCYPSIDIWVPNVGSAFFGYGLVTIFTTTFLYTVFVYQRHTASALAFMTCVRYVFEGALTPTSVPMYERLGPHKALTITAVLATIMAPVFVVQVRRQDTSHE